MKAVDLGFATIRNEAPIIRGWAKTMLYFCERVVALVDPVTDDGTVKILREEFPAIEIVWQDRSLGDSDDDIIGPEKRLIMHENIDRFTKDNIRDGDWVLCLSADERYHPAHFHVLEKELRWAKKNDNDALSHSRMYEYNGDTDHYTDYETCLRIAQKHFMRPDMSVWNVKSETHEGNDWKPVNPLESSVPFHHYSFVLPHKPKHGWRYEQNCTAYELLRERYGKIPVREYKGPKIDDWMELNDLEVD